MGVYSYIANATACVIYISPPNNKLSGVKWSGRKASRVNASIFLFLVSIPKVWSFIEVLMIYVSALKNYKLASQIFTSVSVRCVYIVSTENVLPRTNDIKLLYSINIK